MAPAAASRRELSPPPPSLHPCPPRASGHQPPPLVINPPLWSPTSLAPPLPLGPRRGRGRGLLGSGRLDCRFSSSGGRGLVYAQGLIPVVVPRQVERQLGPPRSYPDLPARAHPCQGPPHPCPLPFPFLAFAVLSGSLLSTGTHLIPVSR